MNSQKFRKAVKYINIIPYVTTFMQTVSIAQVSLGSWIVARMSKLDFKSLSWSFFNDPFLKKD